jgi:hypothetical protein
MCSLAPARGFDTVREVGDFIAHVIAAEQTTGAALQVLANQLSFERGLSPRNRGRRLGVAHSRAGSSCGDFLKRRKGRLLLRRQLIMNLVQGHDPLERGSPEEARSAISTQSILFKAQAVSIASRQTILQIHLPTEQINRVWRLVAAGPARNDQAPLPQNTADRGHQPRRSAPDPLCRCSGRPSRPGRST